MAGKGLVQHADSNVLDWLCIDAIGLRVHLKTKFDCNAIIIIISSSSSSISINCAFAGYKRKVF